jgi:hypothetical protein
MTRRPVIAWLLSLFVLSAGLGARAQAPKINTFYPIGGRAGTTVDVEIRGNALDGANVMLADRPGIAGSVAPALSRADEANKPVWQNRCAGCHELRSPANRSLTPAQWTATVQRMVRSHNAPIPPADQTKIVQYLTGLAKSGKVTAQIRIAPDTMPGLYEVRVVTARGVSTAGLFEVSSLPEEMGVSNRRETAPIVPIPSVANGCFMTPAERHFFRFSAKKGQRLVFNLKGYRYNDLTQQYFNPQLRLFDSTGKQLTENHGYYSLDPLIDWTCPDDGSYAIEAQDLLGGANPGDVYRLTMGPLPYDTVLYPAAAKVGDAPDLSVVGKNMGAQGGSYSLPALSTPGIQQVSSPFGPQTILATPYSVISDAKPVVATLPATMAGRILAPGSTESWTIKGSGNYEFEGFASRLGSSLMLHAALLNAQGNGIAGLNGDGRMNAHLDAGQNYTLRVQADPMQGGPEFVYAIEAAPAHPGLACAARPANVSLRPGLSTAVLVVLTRREGVQGDVILTVDGLPEGVIAAPNAIPPDRNEAYVVLTALSSAKPTEKTITIIATAKGPSGEFTTAAKPQEVYLLNNNQHFAARDELVVAVRGQADFAPVFDFNTPIKVQPRKGVEYRVRINRRAGYTAPVLVQIENLPSGWVANAEQIPGDKSEVTMLVRPDGNNTQPFLQRDPKLTGIRAVVLLTADDFQYVAGAVLIRKPDRIEEEETGK